MLADLLTDAWLRRAGIGYVRGVAYAREGRVRDLSETSTLVSGVVEGSMSYRATIMLVDAELDATCTCPASVELCKHIVAVGVQWLAQTDARPPAPTAAAPGKPPVFESRKDLEEFARSNQVAHLLVLAGDVVVPLMQLSEHQRTWLAQSLGRLPLGEVGTRQGAVRYLGGGAEVVGRIAEAAYRFAHAELADVQRGIAEEQPPPPASDPLVAKLGLVLGMARGMARLHAAPRSTTTRATGRLTFDAELVALNWLEPGKVWRPATYSVVPLVTTLVTPGGTSVQLTCTCGAKQGYCTHALALLDTALAELADPRRADDSHSRAEALLRPSWARALVELDRMESSDTKPRAAIEVWWRIDDELGSLGLTAIVKKQLKSGKLSAGSKLSPIALLDEYDGVLSPQDRAIAEAFGAWSPQHRGAGTYPVRAMLALVGHPRVMGFERNEPITLRKLPLGFTAHASGTAITLEPSVAGERFPPKLLQSLLDLFSPGEPLVWADPARDQIVLIEVSEEARRLWTILATHGESFPPEAHAPLLERLAKLEQRMPIAVPQQLKGRELIGALTIVARLRLLPDVTLEVETFVRPAPGAPLFAPGSGPKDVMIVRDAERGYIRRDLHGEITRAHQALQLLPLVDAEEGPPGCFRVADAEAALAVVLAAQDEALADAGLEIEWVDSKPMISRAADVKQLRVTVDKKRDWFGIVGELKVEAGRLELAILLDAARRQQRFVRIDENRWVELADTLRQRLLAVADQTYATRGRLELSPGAVPAIRELETAGASVATAPAWDLLTERLASATALRPKPPATLAATLRDYQIEGHAWMSRVAAWGAGAVLADDMGLGKTVQAIAVLLDRGKLGPTLVLAPTSVSLNWVAELQRFAPSLRPIVYGETTDRAATLRALKKKDVLIASYGLLARDAELLAGAKFATLVLDEAQALKNPNTRRAKAARTLDASFRLALSGTPFENHLGELWSLFAIVFPGLLGSWEQFRDRYAIPIEKTKDAAARDALSRVIRPFLLRRTKQEVARELPARTEIDVPVALSTEEHALYEDARLAAVAEVSAAGKGIRDEQRRFQVLAALTRLRLLASHPKLYDPRSSVASSKLRRLLELLEELRSEGHRALVFSQFTSHLGLVREALTAGGFATLYLDGGTPMRERAALVQRFQGGEGDAFLISLKAGGTGINLTGADYVIHLDPWWNPAVEDQATDRAHRIGQTKPVTVYRLIARGTIEEQILALHGDKRALVAGVLEGSSAAVRVTTTDLLSLLAGGDHAPEAADAADAADAPDAAPPTVH